MRNRHTNLYEDIKRSLYLSNDQKSHLQNYKLIMTNEISLYNDLCAFISRDIIIS